MNGKGDGYEHAPISVSREDHDQIVASMRADLDAVRRELDLTVAQSDEMGRRHRALHAAQNELQRRLTRALGALDKADSVFRGNWSWEDSPETIAVLDLIAEVRAECAKPLTP